jgi:hypothetical protein
MTRDATHHVGLDGLLTDYERRCAMAAVRPESDDERLRAFVLKCYSATAM